MGLVGDSRGSRVGGEARATRGRNATAAHYPDYLAINLTKQQGAGSLAHEWWHALDNWLAKFDATRGSTPATFSGKGGRRR